MNPISQMADAALKDPYLKELLYKAETIYSSDFFKSSRIDINLSEKDFFDILRFADIMSYSKNFQAKNLSFKILSLLHPEYKLNDDYRSFANAVLTRLGNFPSLALIIDDSHEYDNLETVIDKVVKAEIQKVPGSKRIFTDSQYALFEELVDSNHFSFSGPTSFGKSFVMDAYIRFLITERRGLDNIVILVPTRALINQVSSRLRNEIKDVGYRVLSHPTIPKIFKRDSEKYIFIFTPERLISYFANSENPSIQYMFIDEAQKIIQDNDSRSPLYYHAISMADRKSVKLYFASPNISNSDIFLKLFDKSTDESKTITEMPVAQNRYFLDLITGEQWTFHELESTPEATSYGDYRDLNDVLKLCGSREKNVVYCNSVKDTINYALEFAEQQQDVDDPEIDELIKYVRKTIHSEYYLIDCLKKGIGFHFGRLPQRIRERVEQLFINGKINYLFCTSTLLEGVNLPAKNIFILNNKIGTKKFSKIDFWNLAGRAGRLNRELSGNIVCVRCEENKWTVDEAESVMANKGVDKVEPLMLSNKKKFYENLNNSLRSEPFTRKTSRDEQEFLNNYANILYSHEASSVDSLLMNNFMKNTASGKEVLAKIRKTNKVEASILEQSVTIKPVYQNRILSNLKNSEMKDFYPNDITYESCKTFLEYLYRLYSWEIEESTGTNPMAKTKPRLKYIAALMSNWMNSIPLSLIIKRMIQYHDIEGKIWMSDSRETEVFDSADRRHLNMVINNLIYDIDNFLRFRIKNYLTNYELLVGSVRGESGNELWSNYLEYGTTKPAVIALQNMGLSRHLANYVADHHPNVFQVEGGDVTDFNLKTLLQESDEQKYTDERTELVELFGEQNIHNP